MTDEQRGSLRGILVILIAGLLLGLSYNAIGLRSRRSWGLDWIGQDRLVQLAGMEAVGARGNAAPASSSLYSGSDDPLAIGGTLLLPEIPAVGRPVRIELAVLRQFFDADAALIIDARDRVEFESGHIPGAINLPYDEAITDPVALQSLDSGGRPIVTYCGGGNCEISLSLASELFYAGHERVAVYVGGFPEWVEAGNPVENGAGSGREEG